MRLWRLRYCWVALVACSSTPQAPVAREPPMPAPVIPVRVVQVDGQWRLQRGGQPYVLRGVGYQAGLDALVAAGGNAIRTWGVGDDTRALLDEAWSKGVTVTLGLWLGHVEHSFDYGDEAAVARQLEQTRRAVERYKDHPALLMWGVGNEVELEGGDDPRIWAAIEAVARMIHEVDPHHPTMAVTAELGEHYHRRLQDDCPSIDVWGINSYGGAESVPSRLTDRGWTGPIALTEFGGLGDWERPKWPWGAAREQTSTEKAGHYRRSFLAFSKDPRAIGTFAFVWGRGELPTDTWYSLLGPGGLRYEMTDVLADLWGRPPVDRAPSIEAWTTALQGAVVEPGAPIAASLTARDPEGGPLTYDWVLHRDMVSGSGAGPPVDCARAAGTRYEAKAPREPGAYRLLAVARDPLGGAAFASARFHVGPPEGRSSVALPLWVDRSFAPSGWMGDAPDGGLVMRDCPSRPDYCLGRCRRFEVRRGAKGWSGVVWHHPADNWNGAQPGVPIPSSARSVLFTAWGERGGERVTFAVGNREADGFETSKAVVLTSTPTIYRLDVEGLRWTHVAYGFVWTTSAEPGETLRFQIADITWSEGS